MNVLVTYAGRMGGTAEIAQATADQLCTEGLAVDLHPCDPAVG